MHASRACVIEAQRLFVPCLRNLLARVGLVVADAAARLDLQTLAEASPAMLFVDIDYLAEEPCQALGRARAALPATLICAYTRDARSARKMSLSNAGADCVVPKHADASKIESDLRRALRSRCTKA